jgi:hypothetical protein
MKTNLGYMQLFIRENRTLLFILLLAALVRLWGINFGLPNISCRPDEETAINCAMVYGSGDFNPHFFLYPSLYSYLLFGFYLLYYALGLITGRFASPFDLLMEFAVDPGNIYLISRLFSAILAVATVLVVYWIALRLFNRRVACLSALFLALAHLHVRDSHFGTVDIAMTFLIALTVLLAVICFQKKSLKYYIWAGICGGLATSTKYNALMLLAPLGAVHFFNIVEERRSLSHLFTDRRGWIMLASFVAAFLLGTPYAIPDFHFFLSEVKLTLSHLSAGHGLNLGRGWWYHFKFSLFYGLGWSMWIASLAGLIIMVKSHCKAALILLSFPLIYYFIAGSGNLVFLRYMIPVIPFLTITAALTIDTLSAILIRRWNIRQARLFTAALAVIVVAPSLNNVFRSDLILARRDNRLVVADWISQNLPAGSSIFQSVGGQRGIQLFPTLESLQEEIKINGPHPKLEASIQYLKRHSVRSYDLWEFTQVTHQFQQGGQPTDSLPRYILLADGFSKIYIRYPPEVIEFIDSCYVQNEYFPSMDYSKNIFDMQDRFYVPFAGFNGVLRPGPNFTLYERRPGRENYHLAGSYQTPKFKGEGSRER